MDVRTKKKLKIVSEKVVSRNNPDHVLGNNPKDFPNLANACKAAAATFETGESYRVVDKGA